MIEKLDAMPILVNACPSFEDAWHAHLRDLAMTRITSPQANLLTICFDCFNPMIF